MSSIKNLYFKLDNFELDIPSLDIPDTGVTAIEGSSGAGKTTFLKILIGLYRPKEWTWKFKGENMNLLDINERRLGVVFQGYDLFPHLTAEDNILLVLNARNQNKDRNEVNKRLQK